MPSLDDLEDPDRELIERFETAGQGHVFRHLVELDWTGRRALLDQAATVDLDLLERLRSQEATLPVSGPVQPPGPELIRWRTSDDFRRMRKTARERGIEELRAGRVAVVIAAGGQGTRLGSAAPKGMWPVGPATGKPLLVWHAEKVLYWSRVLERPVPLVIMVSPATAGPTADFLRWHGYFGLDPTWIRMPCQTTVPPLGDDGRLLLESPSAIAMSPNGHGGVYSCLRDSGVLALLRDHGIRTLSYVQVDNPLIRPVDPLFVGFHLRRESLLSSKSVMKRAPEERVGVFGSVNGRSTVVEYTELSQEQARGVDEEGRLKFGQGSIAAHCIDLEFADEVARAGLPYHRAHKIVPHIDRLGNPVLPTEPNASKFEMFLFDAIPLAARSMVMETRRWEEFSPIKNGEGEHDTPATARRDLQDLFRGWHERAHLPVPRGALEVPPAEAPDERAFRILHGLKNES